MQNNEIAIFWFRKDLRVYDNPGLIQAAMTDGFFPIYIFDDMEPHETALGAASKWWTHHALNSLNHSLNCNLNFYIGDPEEIIKDLIKRHNVNAVYWNRCYDPWRKERDAHIKARLKHDNIKVQSYNASLLWEPWEILKKDGMPYKVFTPFYRKGCLGANAPRYPLMNPEKLPTLKDPDSLLLNDLMLLPEIRWDKKLEQHWDVSELGAHRRLGDFVEKGLLGYRDGRNFPSKANVSRLSPYLQSGIISPNSIWYNAKIKAKQLGKIADDDIDCFCSEICWREFSYSMLYYFPTLPYENWQKKFDLFPWRTDPQALYLWQKGLTGLPIVDAGMRELWQTGYIHNRVRMLVASFLTKNLFINWRCGASWFLDCLVDADIANNSSSWQWIAGSGVDSAPYFRIFNIVLQGKKFDSDGSYTRKYIPELANLPNKYLFSPWEASKEVLNNANITLGINYPSPIIDIKSSRQIALNAFAGISLTK